MCVACAAPVMAAKRRWEEQAPGRAAATQERDEAEQHAATVQTESAVAQTRLRRAAQKVTELDAEAMRTVTDAEVADTLWKTRCALALDHGDDDAAFPGVRPVTAAQVTASRRDPLSPNRRGTLRGMFFPHNGSKWQVEELALVDGGG